MYDFVDTDNIHNHHACNLSNLVIQKHCKETQCDDAANSIELMMAGNTAATFALEGNVATQRPMKAEIQMSMVVYFNEYNQIYKLDGLYNL